MDSLSKELRPRYSLRRRLVIRIGVPLLATFLLMIVTQVKLDRDLFVESVREKMRASVQITCLKAESEFLSIENAVALQVEIIRSDGEQLSQLESPAAVKKLNLFLATVLKSNPFVFGAALAFAPGSPDVSANGFGPYVCRTADGKGLRTMNLALDLKYNFSKAPWFVEAGPEPDGVWSEPYFDAGGGDQFMTTYSMSFAAGGEVPAGVATADVVLADIVKSLESKNNDNQYDFTVVSGKGRIISSSNPEALMKVAADFEASSSERQTLDAVAAFRSSGVEFTRIGEGSLLTFTGSRLVFVNVPSTDWVFVGSFPETNLLPSILQALLFGPGLLLLGAIIAMTVVWRSADRAVAPLQGVIRAIGKFSKGDLSARAPDTDREDEIGLMTTAFNKMGGDLQGAISQREIAETKRIEVEVQISAARDIQRLLLPQSDKEVESKDERSTDEFTGVSILGFNVPASEISGDFFDWFPRGDGTFALVIADVCGKGMPAAMVMAVCRTLLRRAAVETSEPHLALARVNEDLIAQAPRSNFTTGVLLYFDPRTGSILYANAGHPTSILVRVDGTTSHVMEGTGTVLGLEANSVWQTMRIQLDRGEDLVLVSDGVTEAGPETAGADRLFGSDRAAAAISAACKGKQQSPKIIVEELVASVKAWSHNFQGDDMTIIAISRE